MASDDDEMMYILLGIAAIVIWQKLNGPLSKQQGDALVQRAGGKLYEPSPEGIKAGINPDTSFVTFKNDTFEFAPGDYSKLNFAQRTLIGLDRIIPGSWLTRKVLT